MTPGNLDPYNIGSDDGRENPFIPKPFYGNARYGAPQMAPGHGPLDPPPLFSLGGQQQSAPSPMMNYRTAWERRYGVPMQQRPAPVETSVPVATATPTPVFHFDP